ncbi:hypothetical protein [Pedobacter sp. MW01-1-1]|uniref:hypothetical protein n=1 Tax=Pedobacter sp. MW01-1-1 TaxID=3383027 RepID=UPI003FEF2897
MERTCLDCGSLIIGRSDKKFCDDACRNNYNNRIKSEDDSIVRWINAILKKNRRILAKLNPDGKTKVSEKKLIDAGFNFNYYTHTYQTQTGNSYTFCYEFGILALENKNFLLVKKEESKTKN